MDPLVIVEREYTSLAKHLADTNQPSYASDVNKYFKKIIILSAASLFEHQIIKMLVDFVSSVSNSDERIINFLRKQAISQKYHQLFDWGELDNPGKPGKSGSKFFRLFGETFHNQVKGELKTKSEIQESLECFLEIGHLRNILVHSNFAVFDFENITSEEVMTKSKCAIAFIEYLRTKLK